MHGEIGQHLAVNLDTCLVQPVDEPAIGQPMLADTGVDALDPKRTKIALAYLTVAIGILPGLLDSLVGGAKSVFATAPIALGGFDDFAVTGVGRDAPFDT